jgi:Nucleotide modification associated domain 2
VLMKLFSYTLTSDDGAAPNPFWGVCSLAIRKPSIRIAAEIGDWIVGLGSAKSPIGDISAHLVYAMKVTGKMTLEEYDQFCKTFVPKKKPDWRSLDYRMRMGDCIYNYISPGSIKMRTGIHREDNQEKDLRGIYALVSKQFYYFGDRPEKLPSELGALKQTASAQDVEENQPFLEPFITWIENLDIMPNKAIGEPQLKKQYSREKELQAICSRLDLEEDE